MDEREDQLTEREEALPEHETREVEQRDEAGSGTADIDEVAIDPGDEPPPVTRSG